MSNPKFAIGDLVAVCSGNFVYIVPETAVTAVKWWGGGDGIDSLGNFHYAPPGWVYQTLHSRPNPYDLLGRITWHKEKTLRPILPGEYGESTQDIHKPIEVDA